MISADFALSIAFRASTAALTIGFLEQLSVFERAYGPRGPFSPAMAEVFGRKGAAQSWFDRAVRVVLAMGVAFGLTAAVAGPYPPVGRLSGAAVLICLVLSRWRRVMASDGAEQMAVLTLVAACLAVVPGVNENATKVAVWFIAGQATLSYVTAGVAKVVSPAWMGGDAIPLIMSSESHGQPWMASLFRSYPALGTSLTRSVVVFECAFPLMLIGPSELAVGLLALGFSFHLGCAVTMGLNAFLLAFPGAYGCVAYVAQTTSPFW